MCDIKLFEKIYNDIKKLGISDNHSIEIATNYYLVLLGGRRATLLEFANFGEDEETALKVVEYTKTLKNTRSAWERSGADGHMKRWLTVNDSVSDKDFKDALTDESKLGEVLGFKCSLEDMNGWIYGIEYFVHYKGKKIQFKAEVCKENQDRSEDEKNFNYYACGPELYFTIEVKDHGFYYKDIFEFLSKYNDGFDTLYKYKYSISNTLRNFDFNVVAKWIEEIDNIEIFKKFWNFHNRLVLLISYFISNHTRFLSTVDVENFEHDLIYISSLKLDL